MKAIPIVLIKALLKGCFFVIHFRILKRFLILNIALFASHLSRFASLFFLLALGNWFGAETGYVSGWGAYWLGMNYPIRFVLFGGALLALCYGAQSLLRQRQLFTVSKAMGLTYLFIALWILSIFGNYDADSWYQVSQARLLPWGLLFAVAAGVCIFISLKTDDGMLRGFGLTFLAINLYTRFFEFFWNGMHKVLFFLILAVSLAVIGRYAERIWHAGNVKP